MAQEAAGRILGDMIVAALAGGEPERRCLKTPDRR
ncbi:hypothetical protein WCLP8_1880018 [uncultured Gammaproteobacteria bacterium]